MSDTCKLPPPLYPRRSSRGRTLWTVPATASTGHSPPGFIQRPALLQEPSLGACCRITTAQISGSEHRLGRTPNIRRPSAEMGARAVLLLALSLCAASAVAGMAVPHVTSLAKRSHIQKSGVHRLHARSVWTREPLGRGLDRVLLTAADQGRLCWWSPAMLAATRERRQLPIDAAAPASVVFQSGEITRRFFLDGSEPQLLAREHIAVVSDQAACRSSNTASSAC